MNRRTWGFVLLIIALAVFGVVLVAIGADKAKDKKETRAYIGIVPGELTSELAQQYGVKTGTSGVLVESVSSSSPAHEAGLRENDVITSVNGKPVTGPQEFRNQISKMKPGDEVDVAYLRGGTEHSAKIKLAERETSMAWSPRTMNREFKFEGAPWEWESAKPGEKMAYAGLLASDLSEGLAKYFKVEKGALVSDVMKDSPAEKAGLKAGDVITKIGDKTIESERDVRRAIRDHKAGDQVDFVVMREGKQETMKVTLGEHTASADTGELRFGTSGPGGLVIGPDKEDMEQLEQDLKDLRIKLEGLPDSLRVHIRDVKIPPIHIDLDGSEPIHHHDGSLWIHRVDETV